MHNNPRGQEGGKAITGKELWRQCWKTQQCSEPEPKLTADIQHDVKPSLALLSRVLIVVQVLYLKFCILEDLLAVQQNTGQLWSPEYIRLPDKSKGKKLIWALSLDGCTGEEGIDYPFRHRWHLIRDLADHPLQHSRLPPPLPTCLSLASILLYFPS